MALHPLVIDSAWSDTQVYHVDRARRPSWIARIYPEKSHDDVANLVAILRFLEEQAYPTERLVPAIDGSTVVRFSHQWALVTTFVRGDPPGYTPARLRLLGAALGRLHSLSAEHARAAIPPLPVARMRPAPETAWALAQLATVADRVPPPLQGRYDALVTALRSVHDCEGLPQVLIHNDAHPANAIYTPDGHIMFIDWDGAGLGPAVLDVGFLLISCDTESPWTPRLAPDPSRVAAVLDGYRQYHVLTRAELERLPDALCFRSLVYGAASLTATISKDGQEEDMPWWWARYLAAAEIAARAQEHFARYL